MCVLCVDVCAARVHCHGFDINRVVLGGREEPDLRPGGTWARAFLSNLDLTQSVTKITRESDNLKIYERVLV